MELYFNSRPHGGRRKRIPAVVIKKVISTHALTEGDFAIIFSPFFLSTFQLTPSRRATYLPPFRPEWKEISTHALTEGDIQILAHCVYPVISTHALTEGDATGRGPFRLFQVFQLTPSRRATIRPPFLQLHCVISTHALTEGDKCAHHHQSSDTISTHALTEGDPPLFHFNEQSGISTHALTEGDDAPALFK